jgi:hypothetical protein
MPRVQAIETQYAGYRFRSRLEARWAVFFDRAGIAWDYEPEGLIVPVGRDYIRYLPDFWVQTGHWGEVKGHLEQKDLLRLLKIATGLSGCQTRGKADVVVFGNVPREGSCLWPVQLHWHDELWAVPWTIGKDCPVDTPRAPRIRLAHQHSDAINELLIEGFPIGHPDWAVEPLLAAQKARFEWGESG